MAASALISIQDGTGAIENQGQGYVQQLTPGDVITFALQSTSGFVPGLRWVLQFESPDTPNLNGLQFVWDPRTLSAASFSFTAPPGGFTARYFTTVQDAQNVLSQFTGEIFGNGQGVTISPAGLKGQAPVANGDGTYTPQGARTVCNLLSYGADPTGLTDSYAAVAAAVADASSKKLSLYVPQGTYNMTRHVAITTAVSIEADQTPAAAGSRGPVFGVLYGDPFWGGYWMGPSFTVTPPTTGFPVGYTKSGNFYLARVGGTDGVLYNAQMFLSQTPCGSLNGLTSFTCEYVIEFTAAPAATKVPFCGGCETNHGTFSQAFYVQPSDLGPFNLTAQITTDSGSFTCPTTGDPFALNTVYYVVVSWSAASHTLSIVAGIPGSAPTISFTNSSATGTMIVQQPWEDFIFGADNSIGGSNYPLNFGDPISKLSWGHLRLSNTVRTYATLPSTEWTAADRDSNTLLMMSFDPAYRVGPTGIVATAYSPPIVGLPGPAAVLMLWQNVFNPNAEAGPVTVSFKGLTFGAIEGVYVEDTQYVETHYCTFVNRKGITRINNSYYWIDNHDTFLGSQFNTGIVAHSWGAAYIHNSGLGKLEFPNFGSTDGFVHGVVFNPAGAVVKDLQINTVGGRDGIYCNGGELVVHYSNMATEGSAPGLNAMVVFNNMLNVTWMGGGLHAETTAGAGCNILVDGGTQYRFYIDLGAATGEVTSHFKSPAGGAPSVPIVLDSAYQGQGIEAPFPWSDGSAPVIVTPLESNGVTVWNAANSSSITAQWGGNGTNTPTGPDFTCRTIIVTDTSLALTGTTALIMPTVYAGYRRRILNMTPKPLVARALTGNTVTIAAFATAEVESDGSGWTRVTPDQTGDFSPAYLDGIVFWANADTLTASPVGSWSYGAANLTQATGATKPTWTFNSANVGGQSSVLFSGSQNVAATSTSALQLTSAMSVFTVVYLTSAVLNTLVSKGSTGEFDAYVTAAGTITFGRGGTTQTSTAGVVAQTTPTIITIVHVSGGTVSFYVNGTAEGTGTISLPVSTTTNAVQLGQRSDAGTNLHGEQPEVILVNRAVSAAEQTAIQRYLGAKYGVSVP